MKKKIASILLLNLSLILIPQAAYSTVPNENLANTLELQRLKYGNNAVVIGDINTSITETIKLKPDTAEFSITYITEGSSPNDASNRNTANMKALNQYLNQLGIKNEDLTTIAYQNYEHEQQQPIADKSKRYNSKFAVNVNMTNKQFFDAVKLFDKNNIDDIKQRVDNNAYIFSLEANGDSADQAKQLAQQKYQLIINELAKLGINDISVASYDNQVISPKTETVKKYYVRNTLQVKVNNFDLIGKIIVKAQELKMTVNNDISYNVSELEKNRILAQYEQSIYDKLTAKAARLLGKQYQLGVPTHLNSDENSHIYSIQPRNYSYSQKVLNAGQAQSFIADSVDIQPPSEFSITLTMSGSFEIVKILTQ
ncbi:SIMPL domain-containing protein [Orbus sturtevantii]|uniref:SIMPL domain-containing protein n=1 Tax=Orbus sturtevantii TaxID=3074109 RepID=UPI00370DDA01